MKYISFYSTGSQLSWSENWLVGGVCIRSTIDMFYDLLNILAIFIILTPDIFSNARLVVKTESKLQSTTEFVRWTFDLETRTLISIHYVIVFYKNNLIESTS
jgi:hypothetical protein